MQSEWIGNELFIQLDRLINFYLIERNQTLNMPTTRVNFIQERERRHSYAVGSEHVINTPQIIRFLYRQNQIQKVTSVQIPYQQNTSLPVRNVKDHVWCYRQEKMRSKASELEYEQNDRSVSHKRSNKFSLLTRKINTTVARRSNQGQEVCQINNLIRTSSQYTPVKVQSRQTTNSIHEIYTNHITFETPICAFFVCNPQEIQTDSPKPRFTHKRQKIFSHASPNLSLNPSKQLPNQVKILKKANQQQHFDHFQQEREYGTVRQKEETVQQEDVPSCILQSWNALQKQSKKRSFLQESLSLAG